MAGTTVYPTEPSLSHGVVPRRRGFDRALESMSGQSGRPDPPRGSGTVTGGETGVSAGWRRLTAPPGMRSGPSHIP